MPKSSHTSDKFLQDFLNPSFDPAAYINATLPPLAQKSASSVDAVSLVELSTQAQTLISQLNAHTTRLSNTLTQLTDDILRSGSRLAYEVELLRGETLSLEETIHETLQEEIKMFVPGGLRQAESGKGNTATADPEPHDDSQKDSHPETSENDGNYGEGEDPEFVKQLQTLTLVRSHLESVIKTFGDAMDFGFPPSEVSVSSSFLSVSAPEPGTEQQSSEEKGQQVLQRLRGEISTLLSKSQEDPVQGIEKAAEKIEGLKQLASVWKGTAEEKGRAKFIESLAKMVEDRHRELLREAEQAARRDVTPRQSKVSGGRDSAATEDGKTLPGGFGLMNQLQKLRGGL